MAEGEMIESYVPARLDRMPWSRWHWLIVVSLGATWILDGLEVTLAGSYWLGAALGSTATIVLLSPRWLPIWLGWRCAFGIGATLGLIIIFFRRWIPESPRWLMIHGRNAEAEQIVGDVERMITLHPEALPAHDSPPTRIHTRTHTPWREIWNAIVHEHRRRSLLGLVLMLTQAFFYNAI